MYFRKIAIAGLLFVAGIAVAAEQRTFTDTQGRTLRAGVLNITEKVVKLRGSDGSVFELEKKLLSKKDLEYLDELENRELEEVKKMNRAAGHELFQKGSLLDRPAKEVAEALKLRPESKVYGLLSWRLYAAISRVGSGGEAGSYRFFGAVPQSIALYANRQGMMQQISVVYANKGDSFSKAGMGEDHFDISEDKEKGTEYLEQALEKDFEAVSACLTEALGEPAKQRFGEGGARRTVWRWDWNGASMLLAHEEGEFVTLSVTSVEFAENEGKTVRIDDSIVKKRLAAAVTRKENGDVIISGIPMVNQGPKGYCVPATFERAMRFMGLEADMYLLAMVGQTAAGGGTHPKFLIEEVKSQVYQRGRRTRDDKAGDLSMNYLKRYIDQGIPIMWTMYSLKEYNEVANSNTKKREKIGDWAAWSEAVKEESDKFESLDKTPDNHHICMIIGYNEETEELAVSDSWGPRYELRWIPVGLAQWVNGHSLFMILP